MRLISTKSLRAGMVIGSTIWNNAGTPLLQEGMQVTERIIIRLQKLNIHYVYVEDLISKDIEIIETIPPKVRHDAVKKIEESFKNMKNPANKEQMTYCLDVQSKQFISIIDDLMNYIFESNEIVTVLSDAFIYDEYIYQHSLQVTIYSISIARKMGYNSEEIRQIGIGAMLHDVGKMLIPYEILNKPGRLTSEEFEIMKNHARYGFDLLRSLHTISLLSAHCAFQHHERLDGSGYPRGLIDFEIHPYAKIIAVADVFDAVTSNRVYRNKMLPSEGIEIIREGSGTLYDERVVNAFQKTITIYTNGTVLLLDDGRRGIVFKQNQNYPERPWLRIFEEDKQLLKATYELDLAEIIINIVKVELDYAITE
ncbi:MAG: HD-GYP domain-containing protein [Kurthia sp.]|nr:HD-GYP domain-containing protein [Candidatus Kurthia equi]